MPIIVKPLSDTEIRNSKPKEKVYKLSDGQGLYLVVQPNGTKFFRFDYKHQGKRKSMSFGVYPEISLKRARELREENKQLLLSNKDPLKAKYDLSDISYTTYKKIALEWLEIRKEEWEDITYKKVEAVIMNNTFDIWEKDIKEITRADILDLIRKCEKRGVYETANRLLSNLNRIWKYAVSYAYVDHNIIADIDRKDSVKKNTVVNLPAITKPTDIKALMTDIKNYGELYNSDISTIYALNLAPYVFLRPFNLRHLEWNEINFKNGYIHISADKMKTKKDFVLPLSKQAQKILEKVKPYSYGNSKFVFPSPVTNLKAISDATLNHALMKIGYKDKHTSHGFRAMFSTTAHENIKLHGFNSDIIEVCLAHVERNKVKAAYNRDDTMKYFEEKRVLVQWYADYIDMLRDK